MAGVEAGLAAEAFVINVGATLKKTSDQIIQVKGLECLRVEMHSGKLSITILDTTVTLGGEAKA